MDWLTFSYCVSAGYFLYRTNGKFNQSIVSQRINEDGSTNTTTRYEQLFFTIKINDVNILDPTTRFGWIVGKSVVPILFGIICRKRHCIYCANDLSAFEIFWFDLNSSHMCVKIKNIIPKAF